MKRISIGIVLSVLILTIVLLGLSSALLATQGGSRWVLKQVPGLTVQGWRGALLSQWHAEELLWENDDMRVQINQAHMSLSPSCLLRSTLCLDALTAARIELQLPESMPTNEPAQGIELPDLQLPLSIEVGEVRVDEFSLNGESLVSHAELRASWVEEGIYISEFALQYQEYKVNVTGSIMPSLGWPVDLQVNAYVPVPDAPALDVVAQLTGSLQNLNLVAATQGYAAAQLKGQVQALDVNVPAQISIKLADFKATPDLPDTLTVADLALELQGDLQKGYHVDGLGVLSSTADKMELSLTALVQTTEARLQSLRLSANEKAFVAVQGVAHWKNELTADVQLQWQDFPWHQLLQQEEVPVQLQRLTGQVSYATGQYQGQIDGDLLGPAGPFTLLTSFFGNEQKIELSEFLLEAGQGRLLGTATVGFAQGLEWLADVQASQLDPAYWLAELSGELAGHIQTQGVMSDGLLQMSVQTDLEGTLRSSPALFQMDLQGEQKPQQTPVWQLNNADVRLGDNRIYAVARVDDALAGDVRIELPRLVQLWPGLAGQANGHIRLSGHLADPLAEVQLQAEGVAYDGQRVGQFELLAELLSQQRAELSLDAKHIWSGETEIGALHIDGRGRLDKHQGQLTLAGPLLNTEIKLAGGLHKGNWLGQLNKLLLSSHEQDWALDKKTAIEYRDNGELMVAAHCFKHNGASLCAGKQRLLPQAQIDYRLLNFPLAAFQAFLPEEAQLDGQINGVFQVKLRDKGPIGVIRLDAGQGELRVKHEEVWETFAWKTLQLNSDLGDRAISSKLQLTGVESGHLEVLANIDPRSEQKKLQGHFDINNVDLSALRPFVSQVETIKGQLEGRGMLAGTLLKPLVTGFVQISEAQLSGGDLPVPFQQLQLRADIKGEHLQLNGGWKSGDKGVGSIAGVVRWADQLLVDIDVKGDQLPLHVEPYADIKMAPDLHISLKDERLFISGKVAVPEGLITIPQLPEQAVHVSADARVLGQGEPTSALQVGMDIDLDVGTDRLRFTGFGLEADLRGQLQVGDNLAGRGLLELLNGRYRAYGQRLELRRARLLFAGPLSYPFLDIEAVRVTGDVTAGLRLTGPAMQPQSEIFSNPAMSQEQALSWLLLGRPLHGGDDDGNLMAQAALALGLMGTAPITSKIAEAFGVQDFSLESEGSGVTSSVVATGRLSERMSLRYGVGVFEPASTLALRYELSKRMYLEAASGLANSLDIFYKRNY
ncbi:translocation/assembly module TamB domain-containing protein [Denitrificimonas sp. JX-1]|uniref:Translocation/assembly module TamB domain-containing protein n=1 Tax=Denitrificimonas halotolerans TaxID=3098930 RepID=A0ABU5GP20_9GAMM|nr:translocation/assembly module TamB domain-containing protein [Denitrificimonas sp. JX-1]MDY7218609.1 translocation/assembly module TamB domain-containing protein [Denitrificimonas sp. JX-1]